MTSFDLAALDMAGTTIDEGGIVYDVLAATVAATVAGPVPDDLLQQWKGTSKREALEGLLRALGADHGTAAVDTAYDDFVDRLVAAYRSAPPKPIPGVEEVFTHLRSRGVKVVLQTGYSAPIADSILTGMGWEVGAGDSGVVDAVVTSDLVPASRPAPYLIFRSLEVAGVRDVHRTLVAGDTPNDLAAGQNAGAGLVVGVGTGSFTLTQLQRAPHTHLLASAAELTALL